MSEVKILIVEDEPVIAEHIALYLNNHNFKVSGIAYDNEEARKQLQHKRVISGFENAIGAEYQKKLC